MIRVIVDGQERCVNGRVAKIILWLLGNAASISAPTALKLSFDCMGETVRATKQESEEVKESYPLT